jgi:hypothetical protein
MLCCCFYHIHNTEKINMAAGLRKKSKIIVIKIQKP